MQEPTNIQFWGASTMRTLRPLWVAEELAVAYTHHPIGPRTGETQTSAYTEMNPKQKVPYMQDAGFGLSESVAISRYLIARYGSESTIAMPTSVEALAREDEWVSYIYGELDETSLYVMRRHGDLAPIYGEAPAAMTAARAYAEKHLAVVAEHMTGKDFVVGDQLGLADIMLVSCLDWAVHYDFELHASLLRYRDLHRSRQAYRRAFDVNYRESS
jgi:glutathione S-transferase